MEVKLNRNAPNTDMPDILKESLEYKFFAIPTHKRYMHVHVCEQEMERWKLRERQGKEGRKRGEETQVMELLFQ